LGFFTLYVFIGFFSYFVVSLRLAGRLAIGSGVMLLGLGTTVLQNAAKSTILGMLELL
jgi:hypothetical protein